MRPLAAAIDALVVHDESKNEVVEATSWKQSVAVLILAPKVVKNLCQVVVRVHNGADRFTMFE